MDARRGFSIPVTKSPHESIDDKIFACVSPVDIQVCPCITHGCVGIGDMPRAVVILHAMRHRVTEANNLVVIPQIEVLDGGGHKRQESPMVFMNKRECVEI